MQSGGWSLEKGDGRYKLRKGRKLIRIHMFEYSSKEFSESGTDWLFGFDFNDDLLAGGSDYAVLDFLRTGISRRIRIAC